MKKEKNVMEIKKTKLKNKKNFHWDQNHNRRHNYEDEATDFWILSPNPVPPAGEHNSKQKRVENMRHLHQTHCCRPGTGWS